MRLIKCVVVGDSIGKTSLLMTYLNNRFPQDCIPTVFDYYTHDVTMDDEPYTLGLHDTAGQITYDTLRPLVYPQTDVFLVCFSVAVPASYEHIKLRWIPEITHHCPNTPFLLVGTQTDRREDEDTCKILANIKKKPSTVEQGVKLAKEVKAFKYVECSALKQKGLTNVFHEAIRATLAKQAEPKHSCCSAI